MKEEGGHIAFSADFMQKLGQQSSAATNGKFPLDARARDG
jgi:hypothetical protein